jgi:hypothetical protein
MNIDDIKKLKHAMLHPNFVNHVTTFEVSNLHGEVNGKQLFMDLYKALEELEKLKEE